MIKKVKREMLIAVVIFLLIFNLLSLPVWIIIYLDITFPKLQTLLASSLEHVLNFLNVETRRKGFVLLLADPKMPQIVIDADCIGWKSMLMFFALVLATPIKFGKKVGKLKNKIKNYFPKTKLEALAIGIPILFIINFLRILTTILIGYHFGVSYFTFVHTIFWREGLILAVILIWFLWLRKQKYIIKQK